LHNDVERLISGSLGPDEFLNDPLQALGDPQRVRVWSVNEYDHEILTDGPYDIRGPQKLDELPGDPFAESAQRCPRVRESDDTER
jgi:hypothetical protein